MSNQGLTPFASAMSVPSKRVNLGRCALLAWVAACEGTIGQNAFNRLREYTTAQDDSIMNLALDFIREPSANDLALACKAVQPLPLDERKKFLFEATSVAIAEGKLSSAANHLLRLLADVTEIELAEFFERCAKRPLPDPGDPSSKVWWSQFDQPKSDGSEHDGRKEADKKQSDDKKKRRRRKGMSDEEAYSILGLEPDVEDSEIGKTYRRLAHQHHPDRFSQASEEEQHKAEKTFARINEAYETLTKKK